MAKQDKAPAAFPASAGEVEIQAVINPEIGPAVRMIFRGKRKPFDVLFPIDQALALSKGLERSAMIAGLQAALQVLSNDDDEETEDAQPD